MTGGWPKRQRAWFWTVLAVFWAAGFQFALSHGNRDFHRTDGATEQMLLHAADTYARDGFLKNHLLPEYPAFGFDENGLSRDRPFVYTHYFPGPAWMLGLIVKFFGKDAIWVSRLIPLSLNVFGLGFLGLEFAAFTGSCALACLLMTLLAFARGLTIFSISLAGHGYVMGIYLVMFAMLFRYANRPRETSPSSARWALFFGAAVGFLQIWFSIDFVPVTFLSAAAMICMTPRIPWNKGRNVLTGIFLGGCLGMALQLTLFSLHLGSVAQAIHDFRQWGSWRMGISHFQNEAVDDQRLSRVLHEYNRQSYGATGFTGVNLLALTFTFLLLGFLGKVKDRAESLRGFGGLALALLGAIAWNVMCRQHSLAHTHFLPRHYMALYVIFLLTALPISYELVRRARASAGKSSASLNY
ncbi:MAG: hypothetical protein HYW49_12160 [Deltaproteobacteria bacterium]|nr:hypothetical protein [Deltaproteobacteria bacterium]